MAVTNRAKDVSEQKWTFQAAYGAIGTTPVVREFVVGSVPFPGTIKGLFAAAKGVSGTPVLDMYVQRFVSAGGITLSGGATSLTLQAVGTSGIQSFVLAGSGNTLLGVQAGDVVTVKFSGADSAVTALSVSIVVQAIQDIKTSFGV
jgi:hypothetical protein